MLLPKLPSRHRRRLAVTSEPDIVGEPLTAGRHSAGPLSPLSGPKHVIF
jgi:hypothetical protein